jgi:hypothetical protein
MNVFSYLIYRRESTCTDLSHFRSTCSGEYETVYVFLRKILLDTSWSAPHRLETLPARQE